MKTTLTRTRKKSRKAHHVATCGREKVSIYRRVAPNGSPCYMLSSYASGQRKFVSYADEAEAIEAAGKLARQMSERQVVAAALTNEQASEYAAAILKLKPLGVGLLSAADTVAESLKFVGSLADVTAAVKYYAARHKKTTPKRVADCVTELLALKEARGKSERYRRDLRSRLARFADSFQRDIGNVTTPEIQSWLDGMKLAPRSVKNYRAALATLFQFAESRGYIFKGGDPVGDTEKISGSNDGAIEIFTPKEIAALLNHAPASYLPLLALGAFAGLRTAEAERLEWSDIDLAGGFIHVASEKAKTRSRRLVPILPNLQQWLAPYAGHTGKVWQGSDRELKNTRQDMLKAAGVKWKHNALRHSFISYRLAEVQDAAKVSLEAGNSPAMIFSNYRELVKPADAVKWFSLAPEQPANLLPMPDFAAANALPTANANK